MTRVTRPVVQGLGLGGALLAAATASLFTRMYLRRRARARPSRRARLALTLTLRSVRRAMPGVVRGAAAFGEAGGATLLSTFLEEWLRQSRPQPHEHSQEPCDRLAVGTSKGGLTHDAA